jgi:hypothetical protein
MKCEKKNFLKLKQKTHIHGIKSRVRTGKTSRAVFLYNAHIQGVNHAHGTQSIPTDAHRPSLQKIATRQLCQHPSYLTMAYSCPI